MPIDNNEEYQSILYKIILYVAGIVLGLTAKLALINKEKTLTVKDFILHSSVAFACAWCVWAILAHYDQLEYANVISVIVGRYGDYVLYAIWKGIKNIINDKIKQ